ncbi:MAG: ATP-binding protein [Bacillota bacterium]
MFPFGRTLRFQILAIIAGILVIPILVMVYDLIYASKTDQMLLVQKEERLAAIVQFLAAGIKSEASLADAGVSPSRLEESFEEVAGPLAARYPGVRLGLYIPATKQIVVEGFLHEYRQLTPGEKLAREQRILREASSGIHAVLASKEPLARIAGAPDDQYFEHLVPLVAGEQVVAVAWVEERINPIFTQTRNFRLVTRYLTLLGFFFGTIGTLLVILNLTSRVGAIKKGLAHLENDIHRLLPPMPGEMGQIVQAINKMAVGLAEKEKLEIQLQRAERLAALGHLVTGIAHEMRNPIAIIKAAVQVMEQELKDVPAALEYARVIKEQVNRQNNVLQELLEFGRPSRGIVQPLNINRLLDSVLTFTQPLLRQQRVELDLRRARDLPPVLGDGEKLKQVFLNLILNAVQAMPGGGRLTIETGVREQVFIRFADTGEGIRPEDLPHLFDPYYTTKKGGSGLGLAITHQIVALYGGEIEVEGEPGRGATFTVWLPAADAGGRALEAGEIKGTETVCVPAKEGTQYAGSENPGD